MSQEDCTVQYNVCEVEYNDDWRFMGYYVPEDKENSTVKVYGGNGDGAEHEISRIFVVGTGCGDGMKCEGLYPALITSESKKPDDAYFVADISNCRLLRYHVPKKYADPFYQGSDVGWKYPLGDDDPSKRPTVKEMVARCAEDSEE